MRTEFDFSPLFRSTVGFDRMLDGLRSAARLERLENQPPYDIERLGEDEYRVTLAVAGFHPDELTVTAEHNMLMVVGVPRERSGDGTNDNGQRQILHRGIAARAFERRFDLADHVKVVGASLSDGLLTINLRREVPEAMRPRRIEIGARDGGPERQQRTGSQAA
ncbi:Hsp20 family protein [Sabulicella rubraurantiaca]|uniref:Hsp20 family protein n=1 Tax=Sabulicella rubraurantiaca TaxID=2811429 RepID=UPI001A9792B1|nr:Hsp20 family protein [Sabulicella rubraurantiaca]